MGIRGTSSFGDVVSGRHPHYQYSSTPHLFVFQAIDDDDDIDVNSNSSENASNSPGSSSKEPIYSSTTDVKKAAELQKAEGIQRLTQKYDTLRRLSHYEEPIIPEDPLAVTDDDVIRIETFFQGHLTKVWVCRTMANLYSDVGTTTGTVSWQLRFTGVPLLLLDAGETKSRSKRQLQLIIAEKGTGFALWRDVVDNLTSYKVQEPHFHTLYLSSDHRQRLGLSFNEGKLAMDFYSILDNLTSDPANISLSGPDKQKKTKPKEKVAKKPPKKADISLPCNFNHVTSVDPTDKSRFFSLQIFSRKPTTQPLQPNAMKPVEEVEVSKQNGVSV